MVRVMLLVLLLFAGVAWISRSARMRLALWIMLGLMALYGILKATGAIEWLAPDRIGVL